MRLERKGSSTTTPNTRSPHLQFPSQPSSADHAMNRTPSSHSRSRQPSAPRPTRSTSFTPALRRRTTSQSVQSTESQHDPELAPEDASIVEEIASIKRYEDFTTIDWVQDAAREQLRRKARRSKRSDGVTRKRSRWRNSIAEAYDAGQAWIVVTLVGAAIGLNAAILNIVTEWLSDIKLGWCGTGFYLNESFCCWGSDNGILFSSHPCSTFLRLLRA